MSKRHFCPDWDYMEIDDTCPEFECCLCFPKASSTVSNEERGTRDDESPHGT